MKTFPLLAILAMCIGASSSRATPYTMNITFDLSKGFYNPSYGDIFYNAPGYAAVPNPVTLRAGDTLHLTYQYLPGQALQIQHTTGTGTQQIYLGMFQDFFQGIQGTFNLSFLGLSGQLNGSNAFTGSISGQNALSLILNTPFTNSAFSFTGLDITMQVTGMLDGNNSSNPAPTFTTNTYEFQAYGDHVIPLYNQTTTVPDSGSTFALLALGLGSLALPASRHLFGPPAS